MSERLWHLRRCRLFERLSAEEIARLESRAMVRTFARKSPIFLPGDHARDVLLLASGRAQICNLTEDGKRAILGFIEPGELFGELVIVGATTRDHFAEAAEKSTILLLPGDEILNLMENHTEVSMGITRLIGMRRQRIERRLKNLLFQSNRQRLTYLLLELVEQYGQTTAEGILIKIKLSHQDLADIIGATRETVTVVLGEMQNEGLVRTGRRKIIICALDRLAESVHEPPPLPKSTPRQTPQRMPGMMS
jgi:CRP-like cAMP-binding protein